MDWSILITIVCTGLGTGAGIAWDERRWRKRMSIQSLDTADLVADIYKRLDEVESRYWRSRNKADKEESRADEIRSEVRSVRARMERLDQKLEGSNQPVKDKD